MRQHKREILYEIARYGMGGILIDILRHPPMAQYDAPLVEEYQRKTGDDGSTGNRRGLGQLRELSEGDSTIT